MGHGVHKEAAPERSGGNPPEPGWLVEHVLDKCSSELKATVSGGAGRLVGGRT